jgi:hypothetical protein
MELHDVVGGGDGEFEEAFPIGGLKVILLKYNKKH